MIAAFSSWNADGFLAAHAADPKCDFWTQKDEEDQASVDSREVSTANRSLVSLLRKIDRETRLERRAIWPNRNSPPARDILKDATVKDEWFAKILQPYIDQPSSVELLQLSARLRAEAVGALLTATLKAKDDYSYHRALLTSVVESLGSTNSIVRAMRAEIEILADQFWTSDRNFGERFLEIAADHKLAAFRSIGLVALGHNAVRKTARRYLRAIGEEPLAQCVRKMFDGKVWRLPANNVKSEVEVALAVYLEDATEPAPSRNAMRALALLKGARSIPTLTAHIRPDGKFVRQAIATVTQFGPAAVEPLLRKTSPGPLLT